jgi:hypothetical protein
MNKCETSVVGSVVLYHVPRPRNSIYSSVGALYRAHKSCVHIRFACADMKAPSVMQLSTKMSSFNLHFFFSFNGVVFPPNFHVCDFLTV